MKKRYYTVNIISDDLNLDFSVLGGFLRSIFVSCIELEYGVKYCAFVRGETEGGVSDILYDGICELDCDEYCLFLKDCVSGDIISSFTNIIDRDVDKRYIELNELKFGSFKNLDIKKLKSRDDIYRVRKGNIRIIYRDTPTPDGKLYICRVKKITAPGNGHNANQN